MLLVLQWRNQVWVLLVRRNRRRSPNVMACPGLHSLLTSIILQHNNKLENSNNSTITTVFSTLECAKRLQSSQKQQCAIYIWIYSSVAHRRQHNGYRSRCVVIHRSYTRRAVNWKRKVSVVFCYDVNRPTMSYCFSLCYRFSQHLRLSFLRIRHRSVSGCFLFLHVHYCSVSGWTVGEQQHAH